MCLCGWQPQTKPFSTFSLSLSLSHSSYIYSTFICNWILTYQLQVFFLIFTNFSSFSSPLFLLFLLLLLRFFFSFLFSIFFFLFMLCGSVKWSILIHFVLIHYHHLMVIHCISSKTLVGLCYLHYIYIHTKITTNDGNTQNPWIIHQLKSVQLYFNKFSILIASLSFIRFATVHNRFIYLYISISLSLYIYIYIYIYIYTHMCVCVESAACGNCIFR